MIYTSCTIERRTLLHFYPFQCSNENISTLLLPIAKILSSHHRYSKEYYFAFYHFAQLHNLKILAKPCYATTPIINKVSIFPLSPPVTKRMHPLSNGLWTQKEERFLETAQSLDRAVSLSPVEAITQWHYLGMVWLGFSLIQLSISFFLSAWMLHLLLGTEVWSIVLLHNLFTYI